MEDKNSIFNEESEDESNVLNQLFKYIRYWYWFVISVLITLTVAYIYLNQYTPIYQVKATLLIKDEESLKKAKGEDIIEEFSVGSSKQLENEITVLRSRSLIGKVIDELGLTTSYWKKDRFRDIEIYKTAPVKVNVTNLTDYAYQHALFIKTGSKETYQLFNQDMKMLGTFLYSQDVKSEFGSFRVFQSKSPGVDSVSLVKVVFLNKAVLINELINSIQVSQLVDNSSFLSLIIECSLIEKGKDILTTLLDEYAFTSLEEKNREATNTLHFIEERLKLITAELGSVEKDVESFRENKGIIDLSSEANLFLQKIEQNDIKINEADVILKGLNSIEEYINNSKVYVVN
ncbi:Wzz/FepE/Etk N-terminal domain-containing protein [Spirosoma linguale]|uniref:Lipopolysaccharide biosynthesis protein n=1 Tax=Spirosoma linguale (strain ATCC 33905 / DSM 74 / LMG 10896 / Claus 1) TaxID=504472 RepID=D2QI96_SPILD|nr:lipopolysaccharide biosynthesis protein [Spirosoma linguale DSM 74]